MIHKKKKKRIEKNTKKTDSVKVSVVCLNNKMIFNTLTDALNWCNSKSSTSIVLNCKGKRQFAFKHPETKEKLQWAFFDDYINMSDTDISIRLNHEYVNKSYKKVICLDTEQIFDNARAADRFYGTSKGYILRILKKESKGKNGIPLHWMYYEDYLKEKEAI